MLFSNNPCNASFTCPSEIDAEVLVFGAGLSGITTAKSLHENGITDIKILEARDEIGGRIRSMDFAGVKVEVGANWIHHLQKDFETEGSEHPIWKLAKATQNCNKLTGVVTESEEVWDKDENGNYEIVDFNIGTFGKQYEKSWEDTIELGKLRKNGGLDDITVRSGFNSITNPWVPESRLDNLTEWSFFDFEFAEKPDVTSLFGVIDDEDVLGDVDYLITDQRGFASIVHCVAQGIEDKIMLGTNVTKISWSDECVCADVTINNQEDTICGKYGIVTFSIGVLQEWIESNSSKFNPQISTEKQEAINSISMGYYLKIFIDFPRRFWTKNVDYILRTDDERGYFPVIQPIGSVIGCPNMILMTVVDSLAIRISTQSEQDTKDDIMKVLREFYGNKIPEPKEILIPTWYNDPLYRGMFSNTHFGLTKQHKDNLAQPDGNLYFSGEAISQDYSGYLEGAYCTGLDVTKLILQKKNLTASSSTLPDCSFMPSKKEERGYSVTPSGGNRNRAIICLIAVIVYAGSLL